MASIRINEDWQIAGDTMSWRVEQRGEEKNRKTGDLETVWRPVSYHQTLGAAAKSLARRRLRTADVEGVAAMVDEWESIAGQIDAAFERWRAA